MMLISAIVAWASPEDESLLPLLFSGLIVGVFGLFPQIYVREKTKYRITTKEGYYIVAGSWLLACLFGTVPYIMYGGEFSFIDALFESVSGFTTTGASILNDIEALPQGLLFWRMSTSWMGGIGIVALFSLVLPSSNGSVLTGVEVSGIARDDASTREKSLVKMMVTTYMALTIISIISLKLCGMRWFDAVTHGMSVSSTCGFSTKNASIGAFNSPLIEMVMSVLMLLSSINFCLIYSVFTKDRQKNMFQSEVSRSYLLVVAVSVLLVTVSLFASKSYSTIGESFRRAFFHVCSFVSTSGFYTEDCNTWPSMCITMLIGCSIVCGCSGSTSGGLKFDRVLVCFKSVKAKLAVVANPNQVNLVKVDSRHLSEQRVGDTKTFMALYFFIIALATLVNTGLGLDFQSGFSASIACLGNVGPGFGAIGTMYNFSNFSALFKLNCAFLMLLGRLELFSLLYVLGIRPGRR